ncbi:hypothetical protein BC938DRAFT_473980 [Jimgerdemannia flammicorona]|uniref:B30.2/SPRY domain-containing protein n=1 Tax=Jimgerdemannia flammicorona TaxID=994334 RepID=A0A433Q358_9FUNG|nr:hypothetical protein BC938DRAFT_473980 [Jimgerdemannia flammicorona]
MGAVSRIRTAKIARAYEADESELQEWGIVVESAGVYGWKNVVIVGLVGEAFDQYADSTSLTAPSSWWFQTGVEDVTVRSGDVVTFHLNMQKRTCSLSINGQNYGAIWQDLPDRVYPAVTFWNEGKFRFLAEPSAYDRPNRDRVSLYGMGRFKQTLEYLSYLLSEMFAHAQQSSKTLGVKLLPVLLRARSLMLVAFAHISDKSSLAFARVEHFSLSIPRNVLYVAFSSLILVIVLYLVLSILRILSPTSPPPSKFVTILHTETAFQTATVTNHLTSTITNRLTSTITNYLTSTTTSTVTSTKSWTGPVGLASFPTKTTTVWLTIVPSTTVTTVTTLAAPSPSSGHGRNLTHAVTDFPSHLLSTAFGLLGSDFRSFLAVLSLLLSILFFIWLLILIPQVIGIVFRIVPFLRSLIAIVIARFTLILGATIVHAIEAFAIVGYIVFKLGSNFIHVATLNRYRLAAVYLVVPPFLWLVFVRFINVVPFMFLLSVLYWFGHAMELAGFKPGTK